MYLIAQIMGFFGTITGVSGIQFKKKSHIMMSVILTNIFFCINFALLEAYSGAIICFISAVQTLINYLFDRKKMKYPKLLITSYFIVYIFCGLITFSTFIDIIPVICAILFVITIIQCKEKYFRIFLLVSTLLWVYYDVVVGAYTAVIYDIFLSISTIIAMVRYDIKKKDLDKFNI